MTWRETHSTEKHGFISLPGSFPSRVSVNKHIHLAVNKSNGKAIINLADMNKDEVMNAE